MRTNYRTIARQALKRARAETASGDPERLAYAALELRNALEAVTYDRAQLYKDEVSADVYRTWQPRKVIRYMAEIDQMVSFKSWEVLFKPQHKPGEPENRWISFGTETLLTQKNLKDHYDALGSFLHVPTPHQIANNKEPDNERLREHCEECIAILDRVLKSPVSKVTFSVSSKGECQRCGHIVIKRTPPNSTVPFEARCFECGAGYVVTHEGPNTVRWIPKTCPIGCQTPGCDQEIELWEDEIRPGVTWDCEGCGESYALHLRIMQKIRTDIGTVET